MTKYNQNSQQIIEMLTNEIKKLKHLISINEKYWSSEYNHEAISIREKIKYEPPKKKIEDTNEYKEIAKNYASLTSKYGENKLEDLIWDEVPNALERVKPYNETKREIKDKTCEFKKMMKEWEALHANSGPIEILNKKFLISSEVGEIKKENYMFIHTILNEFEKSGFASSLHMKTLDSAIIASSHCKEDNHDKEYEKVLKRDIDNLFNIYKKYLEDDTCFSSYAEQKAIKNLLYGLHKKQKKDHECFVDNDYQHSVPNEEKSRLHLFEANVSKFKNLKDSYQNVRGDFLKTKILESLKDKIVHTTSKKELDKLKDEIMSSDEYKVLKKGQGLTTKLLHLDTSSKKALDKIFADQEEKLGSSNSRLELN